MDIKRRDFLRGLGSKTSAVAAAVVTPAMTYADELSSEIKKLSGDLHEKHSGTASSLGERIGQVSNRMDAAALTMAYQQAQLHLIFLLLFISFVIDGGMSLTWLMLP